MHPTPLQMRAYRDARARHASNVEPEPMTRRRITQLVEAKARSHHALMMAVASTVAAYEQAVADDLQATLAVEEALDQLVTEKSVAAFDAGRTVGL